MEHDDCPSDQGSSSSRPKMRKLCHSPAMAPGSGNEIDNASLAVGESCENENLPSNLHPLIDIDLVLSKVLNYLDKSSLKVANLVCTTWSDVARKLMVNTMTFNLTEQAGLHFLKESVHSCSFISVKNEMTVSPISLKLSIGHFLTTHDNCATSNDYKSVTSETALELVGKLVSMDVVISDLKLEFCVRNISTAWNIICCLEEQLQQLNINTDCACCPNAHINADNAIDVALVLQRGSRSFPNLKILSGKLKVKVSNTIDSSSSIWKLFQELIVCSPNLEGLHCQLSSTRNDVFDILVQHPDALQQLKSLSGVCLNQDELQILLNKRLELKSLSMSLYSGFRYRALSPFLSSQGESLELLEIDFVSLPNVAEKFSCGMDLVNLRHLSMKKFFGSIHFVSHMTNLESLTLEDINLSVALHDEAAKYQYKSKLKSLKIFGGKGSTGRFLLPTVYTDIVSFFPEITHLRMEYFTDSVLKIILKGLPHLQELDIPKGIYTDVIIHGAESEEMTRTTCQNGKDLNLTGKGGNHNVASCLADLKGLRKVKLQSPKITDKGICSGLVHCKELRYISIDSPMISDASLNLLCQSPDIQRLEFVNCYQLTSSGISEAKQLWGKGRKLSIFYK